jgi:hypothetical protein
VFILYFPFLHPDEVSLFIPPTRNYLEKDAWEKTRDEEGDLALKYILNFVK